jgi:hypothetical protein
MLSKSEDCKKKKKQESQTWENQVALFELLGSEGSEKSLVPYILFRLNSPLTPASSFEVLEPFMCAMLSKPEDCNIQENFDKRDKKKNR